MLQAIAEEKAKLEAWMAKNKALCDAALETMQGFVPGDIKEVSKEELILRGIGPQARRELRASFLNP